VKPGDPLLRFVVRGEPTPKGSKRAFVHRSTGKAVLIDSDPKGLAAWQRNIRAGADRAVADMGAAWGGLIVGVPVWVRLDFHLVRPVSHKGRTWPVKQNTGDLDKLVRAAFDAMSGVVFGDDAQVVQCRAQKDYGTAPGVVVWVGPVGDAT